MGRETDLLQMWRARKLQRTPEPKGAERHEEMDPWQLEAYEYLLQQELAEAEEAHDAFVRLSQKKLLLIFVHSARMRVPVLLPRSHKSSASNKQTSTQKRSTNSPSPERSLSTECLTHCRRLLAAAACAVQLARA